MQNGKALILATKRYAHDNALASWWATLSTLLLLAAAMAGALFGGHWTFQLGSGVIMSLLLVRFFVIYHDHQHRAILPRSRALKALMRVWGIIALTPNGVWTHSHNDHHHHNSKLLRPAFGSFPVMTKERYLQSSFSERFMYQLIRHPLTILFGYFTAFVYSMCLAPFFERDGDTTDCALALVVHIAIYLAIGFTFGLQAVFFAWFLPQFLAGALGTYLFYAQHNFPTVTYMEKDGWTYEDAALKSSSFCQMGPLMNYFTANIGYHHIHHLNSKIPFYRLPEVYRSMPELQAAQTTSLKFSEVYRCLSLHVWDTDQQRLITYQEMRQAA